MKKIVFSLLLLFATATARADLIVVLYSRGGTTKIATAYDKTTLTYIKSVFPVSRDSTRSYWGVPSVYKQALPGGGWKVDLTPTLVKSIGDSLHAGDADSVAVYDTRYTK